MVAGEAVVFICKPTCIGSKKEKKMGGRTVKGTFSENVNVKVLKKA